MNHVKLQKHKTNAILPPNTENNHRILFRNAKSNEPKNEKQEYKEMNTLKIKHWRTFGILKEQFQIEKEVVIRMIRTEEKLYLDTLTYNLIRL